MRAKLQAIGNDHRETFTGEFIRFGEKRGWKGNTELTVLLSNIKDKNGQLITDHLWFNYTKGFKQLCMNPGDIIQFNGRVQGYMKGYQGRDDYVLTSSSTDYKLSHPTKMMKLSTRI